jgi:hypothetical protein
LPDFEATELAVTAPTTTYNGQNVLVIQPNTPTDVGIVVRNAAPVQAPATEVRFNAFGINSTSALRPLSAGEIVSAKSYVTCTVPGSLSILRAEVNPSRSVQESNYGNNALNSLAILCADEPATPLPVQSDKLDRILAILEEIRDFLYRIFGM